MIIALVEIEKRKKKNGYMRKQIWKQNCGGGSGGGRWLGGWSLQRNGGVEGGE